MNALSAKPSRATAEDWTRFLRPVAMSVRNTPPEDEFKARVAAVAHAVAVPAEWLRQPWRQSEAMRKWQFWPSVADLADLFEDDLRASRESETRRQSLALPAPSAAEFRTPEEILAVQAKAKAVIAELNGRVKREEMPPVTPAYLSDGALLALYEQMGDAGKHRAAVLRKRLGDATC